MLYNLNLQSKPILTTRQEYKNKGTTPDYNALKAIDFVNFKSKADNSQPDNHILTLMRNLVAENIDNPDLLSKKYLALVLENPKYSDSTVELELSLGITLAQQDKPSIIAEHIYKNVSLEAFFYCIKELFNTETTQANLKKAEKLGLNIVKDSNDSRVQEMFQQDKNLAKLSSLIKIYVDNTAYYDKNFLKSEFIAPLAKLIQESFPKGKGFFKRQLDDFIQPHVSFPDLVYPQKAELSKRYKVF